MLGSCGRHSDSFVLDGTLQDGSTDSIIVFGLDNRFDRTDTIRPLDGTFRWSFQPDTVTTLILSLADGRQFPVFAEKGVTASITIPADSGLFHIEGGSCNDAYLPFYNAAINDTTVEMSRARIDSFIVRDPFSEVTPYLLYEYMVRKHHASPAVINTLIAKMSGNMQDAPFLITLKSEMKESKPSNTYLTSLALRDTTGKKIEFSSIGKTTTHVLCCLWASWNEERAATAKHAMKDLADKYADRDLIAIDLSIDVSFDRWKNIVSKDTLQWKSYIDTDGWDSKVVTAGELKNTPIYLLFSGTRRITFQTTSLEAMDRELDRVLPAPKKKTAPVSAGKPKKLKLNLN